ncbi:winged helix-turn-helix transcriptional regulator [Glaciihabitans sp. INWT7]|uniref:ArsR/SmtB family transcription factor n=1 Tax=Glaciihabitans sp. INWT7 TaxID=2596912 RepID=UPI0016249E9C|nr:winged helix-turn-helix domain-containing protein [Glaciihabitans sp. INWT7]QNE45881.1 winged helix-turn-helix transcriptional regulator [Glaciihabitans sp. INWT7]
MATSPEVRDFELDDELELSTVAQVKAVGDPLRTMILGLLHERAATVSELAIAVGRPKGTVAHHVKVLTDAGLLRVVRTRSVRAIDERFSGRSARMFSVGLGRRATDGSALPVDFNDFEVAAVESAASFEAGRLRAFIRHARIPSDQASMCRERMLDAVREFERLPRSGDRLYGITVGLYPMLGHPVIPAPEEGGGEVPASP